MKKLRLITLLGAFMLLSTSALAIGLKVNKTLKVGDRTSDGGYVIEIGTSDRSNKKYPLVKPTDPYYTGEKEADDPYYGTGKHYQNVSMDNVGDIESTWDHYTGKGTLIAIIDSGIEYDHEDFKRNGESIISPLSASFETNYVSDWSDEYTLVKKVASESGYGILSHDWESSYYGGGEWVDHGSNVSGSAAASMNGVGTVGIAPDATILALKIDFYDPSINAAIEYAADCGADVINMSLGGFDTDDYPSGQSDSAYEGAKTASAAAINYAHAKGCIIVAAAGNEKTACHSYPACNDYVIGVGALAANSDKYDTSYTNYNKDGETSSNFNRNVDITAPGSVVAPGIENPENRQKSLGYHFTEGTSFASPIVAGAAALWKEKYPSGTPEEFEEQLYASAYKASNYSQKYYGNGNLDVYGLLDIANEGIELDVRSLSLDTRSEPVTVNATAKEGTITSWSSDNTNVVTVSGETGKVNCSATITVKGAGSAVITVKNSANETATISVTVTQYVAVTSISAEDVTVSETKSVNINAKVYPTNATNQTITYRSNDESIATVDDKGNVKGIKIGETTITLTAESIVKTIKVTVTELTEETYVIQFKTSDHDSNRSMSSIEESVESGGEIIKSSTCDNAYNGIKGIKLGSSKNSGSISITLTEKLSITSITLKACYYSGDSTAEIKVNNKIITSLSSELAEKTLTFDGSEVDKITINTERGKRVYINSISIVSGKGGVTPTPTEKTLQSIALDTSYAKIEFEVGEGFTAQGLVVTVTYSDGTNEKVTDYSISNVDTSSKGTKTVTVSYTYRNVTKTATYEIEVVDKVEPAPESKGCGGTIVTTSIILSSIALVGIILLLLKKKEN